jgi:hypothetical protein
LRFRALEWSFRVKWHNHTRDTVSPHTVLNTAPTRPEVVRLRLYDIVEHTCINHNSHTKGS